MITKKNVQKGVIVITVEDCGMTKVKSHSLEWSMKSPSSC